MRAVPGNLPSRNRRQFGHEQFHCGKPPPAALPRIFTRMKGDKEGMKPHADDFVRRLAARAVENLEIAVAVRVDFAAQTDFFNLRSFPFHRCTLLDSQLLLALYYQRRHNARKDRAGAESSTAHDSRRRRWPDSPPFERYSIAISGCYGPGWRCPPSAHGCKSSPRACWCST